MGAVQPITLVVVRHVYPAVHVEISENGEDFVPFGDGSAKMGTFKIASAVPVNARYVRVRAANTVVGQTELRQMTEISVW